MLDIFTVSFLGHREIRNMLEVEETLMPLLRDVICSKEYVEFLVGREGDFDRIVSSTIRKAVSKYGNGNTAHILVLPYERAEYRDNKSYYEAYYDEVQICEESSIVHPKAAIGIRNMVMVDRADLIICYIEHESGGAFKAVEYAKKTQKQVSNIFKE